MDINALLGAHSCTCGQTHSCDIEKIIIGRGAIFRVADLVDEYRSILLVADCNTFAVCGTDVEKQLSNKIENKVVFQTEGYLIPDESAVELLNGNITANTDLIVGIGSGVIQDLCKFVSFNAGLPYYIIATAPSMDGYASKGAAMIMKGMKITYNAHVPKVIVGDTDILKNAPLDMIRAGYGDVLGKFSCLNDWKLSNVVLGEYFCPEVYNLTFDMLNKTKDLGEKLQNRDAKAVETLFEALVGVGVAMAYAGNSRPASGSEHHLSHFFEITGILNNEPYFAHGVDVAFSSVCTQILREKILSANIEYKKPCFDYPKYKADIEEVYSDIADSVLALQEKVGFYKSNRLPVYIDKWDEIKSVLKECPSSEIIRGYLMSVGLDFQDFTNLYGKTKIDNAIKYGKDLKDRHTVLWLNYDLFK